MIEKWLNRNNFFIRYLESFELDELSSSSASSSFDSAQLESITFVRADIRDITAATINVGGNNGGEIPPERINLVRTR